MNKFNYLKILFFVFILLSITIEGCIKHEEKPDKIDDICLDASQEESSILPSWNDGDYHNYRETVQKLNEFASNFPDLKYVFSIGQIIAERDIFSIRITNEKNYSSKFSCLIDGCIHGCEWEAGEACLYLAEYLLINFENNKTITNILNKTSIYIVTLVNPDGREKNIRWNNNDIDLNRNFDIDFGRLRGSAIPLGKLFGRIEIPIVRLPFIGHVNNCGKRPFSEPESRAVRNLMKSLNNHRFSFYVNCHTAVHNFITPWSAF